MSIYDQLGAGVQGRRSVRESDLLRASVVLLHATTEDLLRSLAEILLPGTDKTRLLSLKIPFVISDGEDKANAVEKISLGNLADHRGSTVDEVITRTIRRWLERSTFNNLGDVRKILDATGFSTPVDNAYDTKLAAAMKRRHLIVHRADRNEVTGPGHHSVVSISKSLVEAWVQAIEQFGNDLFAKFEEGVD